MLPSAKSYFIKGGFSPEVAAWILIACFLAGVIGIQLVSRLLHHFIPSHVVDCDHTHVEHEEGGNGDESSSGRPNGHSPDYEDTPLLYRDNYDYKPNYAPRSRSAMVENTETTDENPVHTTRTCRPSMQKRFTTRMSTLVSGVKTSCDEGGPCYGYGDPCGQECFKAISRNPAHPGTRHSVSSSGRQPGLLRNATAPHLKANQAALEGLDEDSGLHSSHPIEHRRFHDRPRDIDRGRQDHQHRTQHHSLTGARFNESICDLEDGSRKRGLSASSNSKPTKDPSQAHHHHVPTNAFLSIGLQTSIAIALHKLPEGFITYATNHANPKLGFTVFMALFIHNITEGFAMALPLYLALGSRWKAMFWSSLLGGISQPLGAGVAALWFKLAGRSDMAPGENVYGGMFAVTAGIMTSVALQLFSESLGLTHNRNLCITFAFVGMAILGISFALTAE